MSCPYCQQPVRRGVVQSGHVTWFAEHARSLFWYQGMKKGDIPIIDYFWKWKDPQVPASYCENCKKIIIDLEGE